MTYDVYHTYALYTLMLGTGSLLEKVLVAENRLHPKDIDLLLFGAILKHGFFFAQKSDHH